jgi:hypothetical protein
MNLKKNDCEKYENVNGQCIHLHEKQGWEKEPTFFCELRISCSPIKCLEDSSEFQEIFGILPTKD